MGTQHALHLLRDCHLPIATHLIRMIDPTFTTPHAHALDLDIFRAYKAITDDEQIKIEDPAYHQAIAHGGMGFRSIETTAPIAFYASRFQTLITLKKIDPELEAICLAISKPPPAPPDPDPPPPSPSTRSQELMDLFGSDSDDESQAEQHQPAPNTQLSADGANEQEIEQQQQQQQQQQQEHYAIGALREAWGMAWEAMPVVQEEYEDSEADGAFPESETACIAQAAAEQAHARKYQNIITKQLEIVNYNRSIEQLSAADRARNKCTTSRGSSAVVTCTPDTDNTTLTPIVAKHAYQIRTGTLKVPEGKCVCGTERTPAHVLSCKKMRGRFVRHDSIVGIIRKLCAEAGLAVTVEELVVEGRQLRMDLIIHFPSGDWWVDVSVVNPQAESYVMNDAKNMREREKQGKWGRWAAARELRFLPFVVDIFGGLGKLASELLASLAKSAFLAYPHPIKQNMSVWQGRWKRHAAEWVGVVLAHAQSGMIQENAIKSAQPGTSVRSLYTRSYRLG